MFCNNGSNMFMGPDNKESVVIVEDKVSKQKDFVKVAEEFMEGLVEDLSD